MQIAKRLLIPGAVVSMLLGPGSALARAGPLFYPVPTIGEAHVPDVSGEWIVWREDRSGQIDIFAYHISDKITLNLSNDEAFEWSPRISGDLVVWQTRPQFDKPYDLHGFDLSDPALGVFPVATSKEDERLIGVDENLVAYSVPYRTGIIGNWEVARDLIVLEYLGNGRFQERYATNFDPNSNTRLPSIESDDYQRGDFGGEMLVYQRHDLVWSTQYGRWVTEDQHVEAIDFSGGGLTHFDSPIDPWLWADAYAAGEGRFVFADDEGGYPYDRHLWLWRTDGSVTELPPDSASEPVEDVLARGGADGRDFLLYDYDRRDGFFFLHTVSASGREGVIGEEIDPQYARMDGEVAIFVDSNAGLGLFYFRFPDIWLSMSELVPGESAWLQAEWAEPGEIVSFVYSLNGIGIGPCLRPLGGLCLDILAPLTLIGEATADSNGLAVLFESVPPNAPSGREIFTQAVVQRGVGGEDSVKSNPEREVIR
ncbi:MAG: hypothetical protein ACF8PN_17595 [Phycisphaerales bacterium]